MIIWLASYPKSGNTLLRSILSTYFYSEDGVLKFENHDFEYLCNPLSEHSNFLQILKSFRIFTGKMLILCENH